MGVMGVAGSMVIGKAIRCKGGQDKWMSARASRRTV